MVSQIMQTDRQTDPSNLLHNVQAVKHFEQPHVTFQPIAALLGMLGVL